jgi:hypothetical protein
MGEMIITVSIDAGLLEKVDALGRELGIGRSGVIRGLVHRENRSHA